MRSVSLLIVDDSAADRTSMRLAFERTGLPLRLYFAASGRAALDLLSPKAGGDAPLRPNLMIVDVKMPGVSGLDLLRTLKSDPKLLSIPVFLFSGSDDQNDIRAGYCGFASGYIVKPLDAGGLSEIADLVGRLCSQVLAFPEH
jgi:two-component system response regulator